MDDSSASASHRKAPRARRSGPNRSVGRILMTTWNWIHPRDCQQLSGICDEAKSSYTAYWGLLVLHEAVFSRPYITNEYFTDRLVILLAAMRFSYTCARISWSSAGCGSLGDYYRYLNQSGKSISLRKIEGNGFFIINASLLRVKGGGEIEPSMFQLISVFLDWGRRNK